MHRTPLAALVAVATTLGVAGIAGAAPFPERFELPDGYQPEGIAAGKGHQLYVGSIPTGDVYRYDARTGQGTQVVDADPGAAAIGLDVDNRSRLFVAGGPTGSGFVYDARTGAELAEIEFTTSADTFVNDVVVTREAAYFTDSRRPVIYVVDTRTLELVETLDVSEIPYTSDFNLNGIAATANGKTLFAIHSGRGELYRIDPETGGATLVPVSGTTLTFGDGLLLTGDRLYVVRNRLNQIAVLRLAPDLASARLEETITSPDFDVPTTVARIGNRLYLPNARFGTAGPQPADYWVTQVRR